MVAATSGEKMGESASFGRSFRQPGAHRNSSGMKTFVRTITCLGTATQRTALTGRSDESAGERLAGVPNTLPLHGNEQGVLSLAASDVLYRRGRRMDAGSPIQNQSL